MADDVRQAGPIVAIEAGQRRGFAPAVLEPADGFSEAGAAGGGSTARRFTPQAILRFKWTAIVTAIGALAVAQAGIWSALAPEYRAVATIEVQPLIPQLLEDDKPMSFYQPFLETQPSVAMDERLLTRVMEQPEVRATDWYRGTPTTLLDRFRTPGRPLDRLRDALDVGVPRGKQVLTIAMTASRPGEARIIVDALAAQYLQYAAELSRQEKSVKEKWLLTEEDRLQLKIDGLESDLAAQQNDPDVQTPFPDQLAQARKATLEELESQRDAYTRDLQAYRDALKRIEPQAPTSQPVTVGQFELDPEWRRLTQEVSDLDLKIESGNLGDQHVTMREWRRIRESKVAERSRREAVLRQQPATAAALSPQFALMYPRLEWEVPRDPEQLRANIALLQQRIEVIDEDLKVKRDDHKATLEKHRRFHAVQAELKRQQEKLLVVREELAQIEIGRSAPAHIHKLGPAVEPPGPVNDRRFKLAIAAVFGALGAGVGAAFLRHRFAPQVLTVEEVAGPRAEGLLGFVPLDGESAAHGAGSDLCDESIRAIRTLVLPRLSGDRGQVIQITSATPGAGKTTFAIRLARSLASCGKRVLLVDTDLRRPALSARYAKGNAAGLMNLLAGKDIRNQGIRKAPETGLSVLPAGKPASPAGIEVLANGRFAGLLADWRKQYDLIVLDGGPVFPVADGAILAQHVDGTILVVREGHCRTSMVREAAVRLSSVGGRVLGIVFVGRARRGSYGYGYYGGYGEQDSTNLDAGNTEASEAQPG